jgi:hypothetical protein
MTSFFDRSDESALGRSSGSRCCRGWITPLFLFRRHIRTIRGIALTVAHGNPSLPRLSLGLARLRHAAVPGTRSGTSLGQAKRLVASKLLLHAARSM